MRTRPALAGTEPGGGERLMRALPPPPPPPRAKVRARGCGGRKLRGGGARRGGPRRSGSPDEEDVFLKTIGLPSEWRGEAARRM